MNLLGNGLHDSGRFEDALQVREVELATMRRAGAPEINLLITQGNSANSYHGLGRHEEAMRIRQGVYSGRLKLLGKEHEETLRAAYNYANSLNKLRHFEEAKSLMRKSIRIARRVLGEDHELTLRMRTIYAEALYLDTSAMLDDLREAATTLEEAGRTARRVLGGAHPVTNSIEIHLRGARAALRAREAPPTSG